MKNNKKTLLVATFLLAFGYNVKNLNCSMECGCAAEKVYRDPQLLGRVLDRHWNCDSFLIKYSPYRNVMAVLLIDKNNNGYKIEIFDTYARQKIFDFEPMTMPMHDFILREDRIIVHFSDTYGTQIAYDIYTGEEIWRT